MGKKILCVVISIIIGYLCGLLICDEPSIINGFIASMLTCIYFNMPDKKTKGQ